MPLVPKPIASKTILFADGDAALRQRMERLLSEAGYRVVLAADGINALAFLAEHQPAMMFVDIGLPELSGLKTCTLIRRNPQYADLPIIMLSTGEGMFDRARGAMAGVDEYLVKPFADERFLQLVSTYIDGVEFA